LFTSVNLRIKNKKTKKIHKNISWIFQLLIALPYLL